MGRFRALRLIALLLLALGSWPCLVIASANSSDALPEQYQQALRLRDYAAAARILQPLAAQKHPEACYQLARLYRQGMGVARNEVSARRYLTFAAEGGHEDARYLLGRFYLQGIGGDEDLEKARYWLSLAAGRGHAKAAVELQQVEKNLRDSSVTLAWCHEQIRHGSLADLRRSEQRQGFAELLQQSGEQLVLWTVEANKTDILQWLTETHHLALNVSNPHGETPLHLAVKQESPQLTGWLLAQGVSVDSVTVAGKTALHLATEKASVSLVERLLKAGASPLIRDREGETALDKLRAKDDQALLAAYQRHGYTLDPDSSVSQRLERLSSESVEQALFQAVARGDSALVKKLLSGGSSRWPVDARGHSLITWAALNNQPKVLADLLPIAPETALYGPLHRNGLFYAVAAGSVQAADLLLANGVNPAEEDARGATAVAVAIAEKSPLARSLLAAVPDNDINPAWLILAAENGMNDVVSLLIDKRVALNEADERGRVPLWFAVKNADEDMVALLLAKGADVTRHDQEGNTLLHMAAAASNRGIITRLLSRSEIRPLLEQANTKGSTPLHLAVGADTTNNLTLLLDAGADINVRDAQGNTPLILAVMAGNSAMVEKLLSLGASAQKRNRNKQNALSIARNLGYQEIVTALKKKDEESGLLDFFQ